MASSFVPVANTRNGFTIVTQVVPGGTEQYGLGTGVSTGGPVKKLLKGEPKALGTVQIMIGIMTFLFGIIKTVFFPGVGAYSGVTYWGSCLYITSGALSIAADKKAKPSLVRSSLAMNTISAVAAAAAIVLLSFDIAITHRYCYRCFYRDHEGQSLGINGVLLVFSLLELIVSICTSAFACQATDALNAQS
ncbi:membrane-spanning 4-domains subfamily A member 4A-like [Colossoma macropomum]|uniref:membrane-spanning 4-domains subfamily A member 4A-like n=1 Tax=Colossoma macropomum TaxID=42526 RepID=UPI001863FCE3|nr:membrane-spanning 4-domains subfamily A member 4A-like [Colossoma macropomum]